MLPHSCSNARVYCLVLGPDGIGRATTGTLRVMDPYFVLPLLMGASMYYMQKLNPAPPDPMQAKIMQWMPIVFTFFFLWFPAGLVLYWLCNNLLSMGQQYIINRRIESGAI